MNSTLKTTQTLPVNKELYGLPIWIFVVAPFMLLLAPAFEWPHGYYQLLRLISFLTFSFIAFHEIKNKSKNIGSVYVILAIVFNPLVPVKLDKEIWIFLDWSAAFFTMHNLKKKRITPAYLIVFISACGFLALVAYSGA